MGKYSPQKSSLVLRVKSTRGIKKNGDSSYSMKHLVSHATRRSMSALVAAVVFVSAQIAVAIVVPSSGGNVVINASQRTWTNTFTTSAGTTMQNIRWDETQNRFGLAFQNLATPALINSVSLGSGSDARVVISGNGVQYVADQQGTSPAAVTVNNFSIATATPIIDTPWDVSLAGRLFVAAGRYAPSASTSTPATGGIQVFDISGGPIVSATPLAVYGVADSATYEKVIAQQTGSGAIVCAGIVDASGKPALEIVSYDDASTTLAQNGLIALEATGSQINDMALEGTTAYVAQDASVGSELGAVDIVSVADPAAPAMLGRYSLGDGPALSVAVSGSTMYVGHAGSIDVVNIANPASPAVQETINAGGTVNDLTVSGSYLYAADGASGLLVYDISSPTAPLLVGNYAAMNGGSAYGLSVSAGSPSTVYIAAGSAGMIAVQMPSFNLTQIASATTATGNVDAAAYNGYLYVANGTAVNVYDENNLSASIGSMTLGGTVKGISIYNGTLYVADDSNHVSVYALVVPVPATPSATLATAMVPYNALPAGSKVYALEGGSIEVLDTTTSTTSTVSGLSGSGLHAYSDGTYIYAAGYNGGLAIIDGATDAVVGSYASANSVKDVYVSGGTAYLADTNKTTSFETVNVSNPASPSAQGSFALNAYGARVTTSGNNAYVLSSASDALTVINVADPAAVKQMLSIPLADFGANVVVDGTHVFAVLRGAIDEYATSYIAAGSVTTPAIDSTSGFTIARKWGYVIPNTQGSGITFDALDGSGNVVQSNLPAVISGIYDLRSIDHAQHPILKIRANLTGGGQTTPYLSGLMVTWDPAIVSSTSPSASAAADTCTAPVTITFSDPIDTENFNAHLASYVTGTSGMTFSSPSWDASNTSVQLAHSDFLGSQSNGITIASTVKDSNGGLIDATNGYTFSFSVPVCSTGGGGGGGGGGISYPNPTPPAGGFRMTINNAALQTTTTSVALQLFGGPDARTMAISNSADLAGASQIPYASTTAWTLSGGLGQKTVYARFYTDHGMMSPVVSSTIVLVPATPGTTTNPQGSGTQTPSTGNATSSTGSTVSGEQTTGGAPANAGSPSGTQGGEQASTGGEQAVATGTPTTTGQANVAAAAGPAGAGLFASILSTIGNQQAIAWIVGILILIGLVWWGVVRFLKK